MRILYPNLVTSDVTMTATNENASYPIENVYDVYLNKIYKASASTSTVVITWGADVTIDCLGFAYHNISEVVYTLKNSGGSTLETDTLTAASDEIYDGDIIYLSASYSTARSLTLEFTGTANPFYIGYIGAGEYIQMPNFAGGPRRDKNYASFSYTSLAGQHVGTKLAGLRSFQSNFNTIDQTDKNTVMDFLDDVMNVDTFMLDPYEAERTSFLPMYARMDTFTGPNQKPVSGVVYEINVTFREAR